MLETIKLSSHIIIYDIHHISVSGKLLRINVHTLVVFTFKVSLRKKEKKRRTSATTTLVLLLFLKEAFLKLKQVIINISKKKSIDIILPYLFFVKL